MSDVSKTALNALAGEAVGHTVAIGAVYVVPKFLPGMDKHLEGFFRKTLARCRHTSEAQQEASARVAKDVTIMQTAGLSNFVTQLAMLRKDTASLHGHANHIGHDMGRLVAGRIGGTAASLAAEYTLRDYLPGVTHALEDGTASAVHKAHLAFCGGPAKLNHPLVAPRRYSWNTDGASPDAAERHLASVIVSNLVQTAGAIPGNTALQHLFDDLVKSGRVGSLLEQAASRIR